MADWSTKGLVEDITSRRQICSSLSVMVDWRTRGLIEEVLSRSQKSPPPSLSHGGLEDKDTGRGRHES